MVDISKSKFYPGTREDAIDKRKVIENRRRQTILKFIALPRQTRLDLISATVPDALHRLTQDEYYAIDSIAVKLQKKYKLSYTDSLELIVAIAFKDITP